MDQLRTAIYGLVQAEHPMTVRQVFYRLVSGGLIAKTEGEYKSTICRLVGQMRLKAELPFSWIADNSRWMRKPDSYGGLDEILGDTARLYRRDLWRRQPAYVEVWLEKEALAGVVYEVTETWDVPLMVTRGYPSLTFLHEAAYAIGRQSSTDGGDGRPVHLYYLGDRDPSGLDIERNVEERLREFAPETEIHFERAAVTAAQVEEMHLPTRPTKASDTRSRRFAGASVELDAIPPRDLRFLVDDCIEKHIDHDQLWRLKQIEENERELLQKITVDARQVIEEAGLNDEAEYGGEEE
jgi:hypothetical protein